jgi:inner membrane protein
MPSPAAHALGGLIAAFLVDSIRRRPVLTPTLLLTAGAAAMTPDLDLFTGSHRTYSHSIGAVVLVGLMAWLVMAIRNRGPRGLRTAIVLAAAYGSHLVLDWLSRDTSKPSGVMMFWPFSSEFYVSGWNAFGEVSRRYWIPREFVLGNLSALAWEMLMLVPVVVLAWVLWSVRTLETKNEERNTNNASPTR